MSVESGQRHTSIYLFSTYHNEEVQGEDYPPSYIPQSAVVGCDVIAEEEGNTDIIYPGSNTLVVRWFGGFEPASGTLEFAGETYDLEWFPPPPLGGVLPRSGFFDSQMISIDQIDSLTGGDAVITVCVDEAGTDCETRTYRTVL